MSERYTLFTNLSFIQRDDMRIFCSALLLSENGPGILGPHYSLRGFGTQADNHMFMLWLKPEDHLPYTLEPFENKLVRLVRESRDEPLFAGNNLTLKDGTTFFLQMSDNSKPLDIYSQEDGDITHIWDVLSEKAAGYWKGKYMQKLQWWPKL